MASNSSSSASTPAPERDAQLLSIGKQCSHPACLLVDFLPFKCRHCELAFCQEHFKVDAHQCPKYDETKHNRVAPNCPLCNIPVAVKPGQDPNVRMDQHLETECSVVTGKVKAKTTPVCAKASCRKVLFSPIRCDKCRNQFCPAHRFPGDHICSPSSTAASSRPALPNFNASAKNFNTKATAAGTAALDAVKKSMANATASSSSSSSSPAPKLPFNKTDRPLYSSSSSNVPSPINNSPAVSFTATTSTTPNDGSTKSTDDIDTDIIKPSPIINPNPFSFSFKPRPLFATA